MVEENKQAQAMIIILLIVGSVFVGGSVVFFNPLEEDLKIKKAYFSDTNNNNKADRLKLVLKNEVNLRINIEKIVIARYGYKLQWTYNDSIKISANSKYKVICQTTNSTNELQFFDPIEIIIIYNKNILTVPVRIGLEFSNLEFIYGNNFQEDFDYQNWTHFQFRNLSGYPTHGDQTNIKSWTKKRDPNEFDKCLKCTTSNCQFIVLNTSLYSFNNYNLSVDIRRRDNDGVGVILRYSEINGIPRFYLLWHTSDHPMGDEEYLEEEAHLFNWTSSEDIMEFSEIALYYIAGYDTGKGITGFNWTKLNSTYCPVSDKWNNWRINLNGNYFSYSFDLNQILSYDNLTMANGSIGLASFESRGSCFDNLFIW